MNCSTRSFLEIGALARTPGDPTPSTATAWSADTAPINGRPVGVFSHDQSVFGGSVGEMFGRKVAKLMEWVAMVGCPIIGINDPGGARIQDAVTSLAWYAELGRRHELLSGWCRRSRSSSASAPAAPSTRRSRPT